MDLRALEYVIEQAFDARDSVNVETQGEIREAVEETLNALDTGALRVAEKMDGTWVVNQWAKKAVLLGFRLNAGGRVHKGRVDRDSRPRRSGGQGVKTFERRVAVAVVYGLKLTQREGTPGLRDTVRRYRS